MDKVVFQNQDYCVIEEGGYKTGSDIIIAFQNLDLRRKKISSEFYTNFGKGLAEKLNKTFLLITPVSNCWYTKESFTEVVDYIRESYGKVSLCYGASMGGYAAINYSNAFQCDFIALSPQATIAPHVLNNFDDSRWLEERNNFNLEQDNLLKGLLHNSKGIVVYDPSHVDGKHADLILNLTNSKRVRLSGSRHTSARYLNHFYGLKNIINEALDGTIDSEYIESSISDSGYKETLLYFSSRDGFNRKKLHEHLATKKGIIEPDVFENIIDNFLNDDCFSIILILVISLRPKEYWEYACISDLLYKIKSVNRDIVFSFLELVDFRPKDIDFVFKVLEEDAIEFFSNREKVSADFLRDLAVKYEPFSIEVSFHLMQYAKLKRPKGEFINNKLKEYEKSFH